MIETFKPVVGYEGLYEVSDMGGIKILSKKLRCKKGFAIRKEKMMSLKTTKRHGAEGYQEATLRKDGESTSFMVHRLVAIAFIPNPDNKPEVNHKFGVRNDNRVSELEWMTKKENMKHAFDNGAYENRSNPHKGTVSKKAKLTEEKVIELKEKYNAGGTSTRKLAAEYGVHHAIIFGIIKGTRWSHVTFKKAS